MLLINFSDDYMGTWMLFEDRLENMWTSAFKSEGFCTTLTFLNTQRYSWSFAQFTLEIKQCYLTNISVTPRFSAPDRWSVPRGSDTEHHHLANVHGESLSRALHDVQRNRTQRRQVWGWRVKALSFTYFFLLKQLQKYEFTVFFYTYSSLLFPVRESTFGKMSYLQPMDTRQYLYCLKPKPEYAEKAGVIKGVTVIGKLDIVWKTNLGERGRLQTSQLQRMVLASVLMHMMVYIFIVLCAFLWRLCPFVLQAPGYGDIRLSLEMIPDTVNLEEPFDIICKITNCRWKSSVQ